MLYTQSNHKTLCAPPLLPWLKLYLPPLFVVVKLDLHLPLLFQGHHPPSPLHTPPFLANNGWFLICTNFRPFRDLSHIESTLTSLGDSLRIVELMGLTQERVMEFVDTNAKPDRKEFIKQTLNKNPILLSVSAITFYCAALCRFLGDDDEWLIPKLATYTQITAYIMLVSYTILTTTNILRNVLFFTYYICSRPTVSILMKYKYLTIDLSSTIPSKSPYPIVNITMYLMQPRNRFNRNVKILFIP